MSLPIDADLQEKALANISDNGGFRFTNTFFPYTSGQIGNYYVQSGVVMKKGECFTSAINHLVEAVDFLYKGKIPKDLVIAGGETRDWIFALPLGAKISRPTVMIYKNGKTVGADIKDNELLLVSDLNNEGSSPRDYWIPTIRKNDGFIEKVLFYIDRLEDGVQEMRKLHLDSRAIAPLGRHAWDFLMSHDGSGVTPEIYKSLRDRLEDKKTWAEKMLRSDAGLENLVKLFNGSKEKQEEARKILEVGYPQLKEELIDRLKSKGVYFV